MREDDALREALIDLDFTLFEHAQQLTPPLEEEVVRSCQEMPGHYDHRQRSRDERRRYGF